MAASDPHGTGIGAARWRAFTALVAVERGRAPRLRDVLRVDDLPARDRALALELAGGVERRRITLDAALLAFASQRRLPADPFVRTALRLGAYQVLYLPRIKPYAAVHTAVGLLRAQKPLVNALLRRLATQVVERPAAAARPRDELALPAALGRERTLVLPADTLPDPVGSASAYLAVVHGLPAELLARWLDAFGAERTGALAAASAAVPAVTVRCNRARTDGAGLQRALAGEGIVATPAEHPLFLRLVDAGETPLFASKAYRDGLFTAQDQTAFLAAEAVAPAAGERILDLCAAPGGKATAVAEMLGGRGTVVAYDADRTRLALVREAGARLGLQGVLQVVEDLAAAPGPFAAVLADVPCSNSGVLARRVEVRRRSIATSLAKLVPQQVALLQRALACTRPGGRTVYSTCSLEAEENRGVVDAVLAAATDARLLREQLTLPQAVHDGGYFAVLQRGAGG